MVFPLKPSITRGYSLHFHLPLDPGQVKPNVGASGNSMLGHGGIWMVCLPSGYVKIAIENGNL